MKIQNLKPEEYAALWGSTTKDGVYFYNFGSSAQKKTTKWLKEFRKAINRLILSPQTNNKDTCNLKKLGLHVDRLIEVAKYQGGVIRLPYKRSKVKL